MSENDEEKEHEPTQKKLEEARRRGEVVRSTDLGVAAAYGGLVLILTSLGVAMVQRFGTAAERLLDQSAVRWSSPAHGDGVQVGYAAGALLFPAAPLLLGPAVLVIAIFLAQRAVVFAPEKLKPKLSRIDPISNAKQKFGRSGLFEFAKSAVKMAVIAALLGYFLWARMPRILMTQSLAPALLSSEMMRLIVEFLFLVLLLAGVMGAIDYLWQRAEHLRRNRMSRQEVVDEMKQSEGDPHVRAQRRQRAERIATNRMLADVPKADVVIVNPTHYAVALRWDRASGRAPVCVAKGVDEVAARIREAASLAGVPIRPDPPTARALHAAVEVGREVLPEHYAPVAAAIRFAEAMRRKARARRGG